MKIMPVLRKPASLMEWKLRSFSGASQIGRQWVEDHAPILSNLKSKMKEKRPFEGLKIGVSLPGTWDTFQYLTALEAGGATLLYCPHFCRSEVALEMIKRTSIEVLRLGKADKVARESDLIHDSTAFLGAIVTQQQTSVKGIIEQTGSGISSYKKLEKEGLLRLPVFNLDASYVKSIGENKLATGLGLVEALFQLHVFLPLKRILVLGYGNVGQGCATYLTQLGCKVSIYDQDAEKASEAKKAGHQVGELNQLLRQSDIIVNATGSSTPVINSREFENLKSGTMLVNMGGNGWDRKYFENKPALGAGPRITKIYIDKSKYIYEIAHGYPANFVLASGTDSETMDVVFSLSLLTMKYLADHYQSLPAGLQPVPEEIQLEHLDLVRAFSVRTDLASRGLN